MNKPSVYLDGLPRTTPRAVWRSLYRLARVTVREAAKAADDMALFGTGFIWIPPDGGDPEYVTIHEMRRRME